MNDMERNLLIFGAGYSAAAAGVKALRTFKSVTGTTRSAAKAEVLHTAAITPVIFDRTASPMLADAIANATDLLVSAGPQDGSDPVLAALLPELAAASRLRWICYLSTVGVYGDHGGAWVDEQTPVKPASARSVERVAAETAWRDFADQRGIGLSIFRLSGIYGPGRNAFVNIVEGTSRRLVKPGQVFNRIHRDDIARAFVFASQERVDGIFNITDDEPAPPQDVVAFAHQLAGVAPPPEQDFATAQLSPMARSFYGENKRVSNVRSKTVLGMDYAYPNYRVALARMWNEQTWR
jgi:nucleoside-diphosphate-sugar epimerase